MVLWKKEGEEVEMVRDPKKRKLNSHDVNGSDASNTTPSTSAAVTTSEATTRANVDGHRPSSRKHF